MAISTLSLTLPEQKEATRSQYQRAAVMLAAAWPTITGMHPALQSDDFLVLSVILARGPGRSVMRQKGERPHKHRKTGELLASKRRTRGLADWLRWPRQRAWRSITRLSDAFLLWGVLYQEGDRLPSGQPARTNIVRYVVRVEAIFAAYDPEAFAGMAAARSENEPPDGPKSGPPLRSPGSDSTTTPKPPPQRHTSRQRELQKDTPPMAAPENHYAPDGAGNTASETPPSAPEHPNDPNKTDRSNAESLRGQGEQNADHIAALGSRRNALQLRNATPSGSTGCGSEHNPLTNAVAEVALELVELEQQPSRDAVSTVVAAWDALRMPEQGGTVSRCRKNERTLITRRLAELPLATLLLAIAGADVDRRLRRGLDVRAACAYVFANTDQVRKFAAAGETAAAERAARELHDRAQQLAQCAYERGQWLGADEARAIAERERATGRGPWARPNSAPANDEGR